MRIFLLVFFNGTTYKKRFSSMLWLKITKPETFILWKQSHSYLLLYHHLLEYKNVSPDRENSDKKEACKNNYADHSTFKHIKLSARTC